MVNILDDQGKPFPNARQRAYKEFMNSAYVSGSQSRRSVRGWQTSNGSADYDLSDDADAIRERCRDLYRNTPLGAAAVDKPTDNVIGSGLKLQCQIKRDIIGLSDEDAAKWERDVEARFDMWAKNKDCDLARTNNFYQLTVLAFRNFLMSGEVFGLTPLLPRKNNDCDVRVAVLEADFVSNPMGLPDKPGLSMGIEYNTKTGEPIKYHFTKTHPGSETPVTEWKAIPAYGPKSGRRNVIHLYKMLRPGQRRGVSFLSPVVETIKQLSRLSEAELMKAVVQSLYTVFVKTESKTVEKAMGEGFTDEQSVLNQTESLEDAKLIEMGNGTIVDLAEGEDVEFADPTSPNDSFTPFFDAICEQIGTATGIGSEVLKQQFTKSYSASRAAINEFWKYVTNRRTWMSTEWCNPIYEEFLTDQIVKGFIKADGFFTDNLKRYAWLSAAWKSDVGRGTLDPTKEIKAAVEKVNNNMGTYENEFGNIDGGDWTEAIDRLKREKDYLKSKGLIPEPVEADKVAELGEQVEELTNRVIEMEIN